MMRHQGRYLALPLACILPFLAITGCDHDDEAVSYRYAAVDSAGTVVVKGRLLLTFHDVAGSGTVRLTGRWDLRLMNGTASAGPQVGRGRLEGNIDADGAVWINLHPNIADNNVFLDGRFVLLHTDKLPGLSGIWTYATFAGVTAGGFFEAVRES